jgi:hypothetical protein
MGSVPALTWSFIPLRRGGNCLDWHLNTFRRSEAGEPFLSAFYDLGIDGSVFEWNGQHRGISTADTIARA